MAFIHKKIDLPDEGSDEFVKRLLEALLKYTGKLADVLNGGMRINENNSCEIQSVSLTTADTEVAVSHSLRRTPVGFIVINVDKAAIVYDSGTSWTSTNIYLKASQDSTTAKLLIF